MFFFLIVRLAIFQSSFLNELDTWHGLIKYKRQPVRLIGLKKSPQPSFSYEHIEIATNEVVERRNLGMGPSPVVMEKP